MRRPVLLAAVPVLAASLAVGALAPAGASSHREAPLIAQDPAADNTDVYAFVSPDRPDTVTLIANVWPLEEPSGGPNYYFFGNDVQYVINIDNNGDAVPDIKYKLRFRMAPLRYPDSFLYNVGQVTSVNDNDLNLRQQYSVVREEQGQRGTTLANGLRVPPANIGPVSTPNYESIAEQAVYTIDNNTRVFAGQRDDPFFVDIGSIFDLGQLRPFLPAYKPAPRPAQAGKDGLGYFNVQTIALQIPISRLTANGRPLSGDDKSKDPNAVIGVWSTTERRANRVLNQDGTQSESGQYVQVSRLGNPLVNEVVIPLSKKDLFNRSEPKNDAQFLSEVTDPELAHLVTALYGIPTPSAPRDDLVKIFLTGIPGLTMPQNNDNPQPAELLRLNMGVAPTPRSQASPLGLLGGDLDGFPNGRRLLDDVTDIELRAVAGGTPFTPEFNRSPNNDLGDGVNSNGRAFLDHFPYVATPWQGFEDIHGRIGSENPIPLPDGSAAQASAG